MPPPKITFFGNFGTHNLGNECTLQAIIANLRTYLPDARVNCICSEPQDTSARYNIPAFRMTHRPPKGSPSRAWVGQNNPIIRLFRRIFIRTPAEVLQWIRAFTTLKGTNMLVMTGTGMLGDFGIRPFDLHYEILKWSLVARLRGCKLLFVSVGAGRIHNPLSRWLVKSALSLADYRSYRDCFSQQCLDSIGFNTRGDSVYPDLAFSLPPHEIPGPQHPSGHGRVIGLGLMEYYGNACSREEGEHIYHAYREKLTSFLAWLLEQKYTVRLLIGDLTYDTRVKEDVLRTLTRHRLIYDETQLINEPVTSVNHLISQLAATDMVVATRFHNVLLALMLNKPVLSISYDQKNDSLMAAVGLGDYCQSIDTLDINRLVEQFLTLRHNTATLKPYIKQRTEEYRAALQDQYRFIFTESISPSRNRNVPHHTHSTSFITC